MGGQASFFLGLSLARSFARSLSLSLSLSLFLWGERGGVGAGKSAQGTPGRLGMSLARSLARSLSLSLCLSPSLGGERQGGMGAGLPGPPTIYHIISRWLIIWYVFLVFGTHHTHSVRAMFMRSVYGYALT